MELDHRIDGPEGAPLLVLGASLGTTMELWEPQLAALTRNWRVLRYDHPGHGGSPAHPDPFTVEELAAAVLGLTGGERFVVGGVSFGGAVALTLALTAPDRVDGLILVCSAPRFGEPATWHERAAQVRAQGMAPLVPALLDRWFTDRAAVPVARIEEMLHGVDPASYAACCAALSGYDLTKRLGEVAVPTLVIGAERDPVSPPDQVRAMAEEIPGARMGIVAGAAHLAGYEKPEEVLALMEDFLAERRGR